MRQHLVTALFVLAAAIPVEALAFGTISGLGQNKEHERITRHALSCAIATIADCFQPSSIAELAGRDGTFGAVGAPDNPIRGLMSSSAAHCDNGDFLAIPGYRNTALAAQTTLQSCRDWMETHMTQAVTNAAAMLNADGTVDDSQMPTIFNCTFDGSMGRAKCNVLEEFGLVLHASEDFYSHSNWTDMADPTRPISPTNPPGLANTAPSPWIDLRVATPAFPPGLISGCYEGFPEMLYCNAGPGGRVKHEYLNKDKGQIDPTVTGAGTPRGLVMSNFVRSVTVAISDTQDKWAILKERLLARYGPVRGATMICALTHDDPATDCVPVTQQQGATSSVGRLGVLAMLMLLVPIFLLLRRRGRGGLQPG